LIYRRRRNFWVVQRLLSHTKLESSEYLAIEVDDALEIVEQTEVQSRLAGRRPAELTIADRTQACG